MQHIPVLLQASIEALRVERGGTYIDATFGRGGHSRALLDTLPHDGRLIAIDKDLDAVQHAASEFKNDTRFHIEHDSFAHIRDVAEKYHVVGNVQGILFDLGVSSPQLDNADRGFSFLHKGPLDMRMNQTQSKTAYDLINSASAEELSDIFKNYGEERFARRIAKAIVEARQTRPIDTTDSLAEIVKVAHPRWEKHKHPATRVFQAIRIYINQELEDLKTALHQVLDILAIGGRLAIISFHSLEDRIVKHFMKEAEQGPYVPVHIPIQKPYISRLKRIGKAVSPSDSEMSNNIRARSARLRIGEKIA